MMKESALVVAICTATAIGQLSIAGSAVAQADAGFSGSSSGLISGGGKTYSTLGAAKLPSSPSNSDRRARASSPEPASAVKTHQNLNAAAGVQANASVAIDPVRAASKKQKPRGVRPAPPRDLGFAAFGAFSRPAVRWPHRPAGLGPPGG